MRTILTTLLLVFCMQFVSAETIIFDKQKVWGTWNKKGSPYIIQGEAIVPEGKTLTIKAGVEIKFKTSENEEFEYSESSFDAGFLRVNGKIVAKGKKGKPILFTRMGVYGNWGNVLVNTTDKGSSFSYCRFEYGHYIRSVVEDDNATGVLTFLKSTGKVEYCVFAFSWSGLNCKQGSDPVIDHCTISGNQYGLECNTESQPVVKNTIIYRNETTFYLNSGKKVPFSYSFIHTYSIAEEEIDDAGNNIVGDDINPGFIDVEGGDFRLKKGSSVAGKGEKGSNIGAF